MRHSHKSTKWNKALGIFRRALVRQVKKQDAVTLTEVAGRLGIVPGWRSVKTSELAILWRWVKYKSGGRKRVHQLSDRGLPTRGGQKVDLLSKPLIDRKTKETHLVAAFHVPSEAEGNNGFALSVNAEISQECWDTMALLWMKWVLEYDHVHMAGDANLDFKKQWVREMADERFTNAHFTWGNGRWKIKGGTHGDRLIDWTISTDPITNVELGRYTPDTDHTEYEETL